MLPGHQTPTTNQHIPLCYWCAPYVFITGWCYASTPERRSTMPVCAKPLSQCFGVHIKINLTCFFVETNYYNRLCKCYLLD